MPLLSVLHGGILSAIPVYMLSWSLHMHARYRSLLSVGDLILLEECSGGFLDILSSESSTSNIP